MTSQTRSCFLNDTTSPRSGWTASFRGCLNGRACKDSLAGHSRKSWFMLGSILKLWQSLSNKYFMRVDAPWNHCKRKKIFTYLPVFWSIEFHSDSKEASKQVPTI
ncbi:hypothetical protein ACQJBY_053039 [Aegilops geniculata]